MPKTKTKTIAWCYVCHEEMGTNQDIYYGIVKENPFHQEAFCLECWPANPGCHAAPWEWERLELGHQVWPVAENVLYCPTCARYGETVTFETDKEFLAHFISHYPKKTETPAASNKGWHCGLCGFVIEDPAEVQGHFLGHYKGTTQ
jgi:hypothetical protein